MPKSNLYAKANRHIALQVWFGTLESYFPLHVSSELQYLRQEWGNPACLFRGCLIGYDPEEEPKTYDPGPPKKLEFNTHGSCGNTLHEHTLPWSLVYQPLEEIRDYFGDDVGLYFSWLGKYTKVSEHFQTPLPVRITPYIYSA